MDIQMRDVSLSDMGQILSWRNSEAGVRFSKSNSSIPTSRHNHWFESRLRRNPHEPFLIFSIEKQDIGFVRFDFDPSDSRNFLTSIILDPELTSRGYGSRILSLAINYIIENYPEMEITAEIHDQNIASVKMFLNNHFVLINKVERFGLYKFVRKDQNLDSKRI
jgi:RimJ/RimL family protein N-acetyltransferase